MFANNDPAAPSADTPVEKLREAVAGLIDVVATQGSKAIDTLGLRNPGKNWIPNVDVVEAEEQVVVTIDLPGIDPDGIEIVLQGNMLTVKGRHPVIEKSPRETSHRRERPLGAFCRSIPLPVAVDPDHVNAESRHGVLTIRLAKADRLKSRQIPIEVRASA